MGLKTYTVGLTRLAIVHTDVEVIASSADAAMTEALRLAKVGRLSWEIDQLYSDGKPHSSISVSNLSDEDNTDLPTYDRSVMP